jgi:hypothetical protein
MASKKPKLTPAEKQLDEQLNTLQDSCVQELRMHYVTQQQERENLAKIYYWWQEAYKIPDYYNAKLAHLPQEQLRKTSTKFNFAPVLRLFYGVNTLGDSKRSRMSSALNAIHEEWQAKPKLYKQDVSKLANYIDQNSGVTGLAKQQAKISPTSTVSSSLTSDILLDEHEADEAADRAANPNNYTSVPNRVSKTRPERAVTVEVTDMQRREALAEDAEEYWRKASGVASFDLDFGVNANKRKYSLALVRVDGKQLHFIDSNIDEQVIKSALLASYRKQFTPIPSNLRFVLEMLRTQFVTGKLKEQLDKVPELGFETSANGKRVEARKRLVFIPTSNQLLLSPIGSRCGVVTKSVPTKKLIKFGSNDFYLPSYSNIYLEKRLLGNDDINQFSVTNVGKIMAIHKAPSIVYAMKLTNKAMPADFAYIDIVSFAASDKKEFCQVALNDDYVALIKARFKVDATTMHKLAKQYADKWIESKGDHASRRENDLCSFAVASDAFEFELFDKAGDIGADTVCTFSKKLKLTNKLKHLFKCRDLMPALSGIGALQLDGDVELILDSNVLVFKYSTTAATYVTAIPTFNKQTKKRNENAFVVYQPKAYTKNTAVSPSATCNFDEFNEPIVEDDLMPVYCYA